MRLNQTTYNRIHVMDLYGWGEEWMKPSGNEAIDTISLGPFDAYHEDAEN